MVLHVVVVYCCTEMSYLMCCTVSTNPSDREHLNTEHKPIMMLL